MIAVQQLIFQMPELIGEIHMNTVRIFETQRLLPERIQLLMAIVADLHNLRRLVHAFSVLKDRHQQLPQGIAVRGKMSLLPGLDGIKQQKGIGGIIAFLYEADQVSDDLAGILIINALNGLVARVGDLLGILRKLDLGNEFAGLFVLDGSQLVDTAKGRAILGSNQVGAHTPGIDGGTLQL